MVPPPPDMDPHSADLGRRGYYYRGCSCNALSYAQRLRTRDTIIDINLAYTSKFFSHEVLTCMYSKMTFVFQCTCSILYHISTNNILSDSLERIKFFWAGHMSDEAFVALSQLPLRRLTAVIGDFTTRFLTSQETIFRRYFLRPTIHITQALGLPELLQLRDLESVRVVCYGSAYILMSEDDRLGLEHLLREFLTRRRVKTEDEYASD
ncbi:hypothetical protein GL218_01203 [Daldinia childiae]|uniref:uncharacterized protein n=1 Tax=Daldinia childiae TaxID=326645 RepID=UPI00144879F3|nr:uncharacterized protein GL218_01203 [Daldinia childiae]KAF3064023.1 hypothetical protein GL218_01203 [Daldinia childiae]